MESSDAPAAPLSSRFRLLLFPVGNFLTTGVFWMILAFLPLHLKSMGFSDPSIGLVMGLYSAAALVLMLPLGIMSDRVSPRWLLVLGGVIVWTHMIGLRLAQAYWQFVVLAVIGGCGLAAFQIILYALYLKVIDDERRGKKIAIFQIGQFLGFGVGPLVAGLVATRGSYLPLFDVAAAGALLLNICALALPDSPPLPIRWRGYGEDLKDHATLLFLAVYFIYSTHFGVEHMAFSLLMRNELGFGTAQIGVVFFCVGIWMCIVSPLTGHRFDLRQNLLQIVIFGLVVSAAFQMMTAYATSLAGMVATRLLHTLGDAPVILWVGIMTAVLFPRSRMGGSWAIVHMVRTIGAFTGNIAAGCLATWTGYGGVFIFSGAFVMVVSLFGYPLIQRRLAAPERARPTA